MNLYFYTYTEYHQGYMRRLIFNSVHNPDVSISHSAPQPCGSGSGGTQGINRTTAHRLSLLCNSSSAGS
jgi:hypothetical protein